MSNQSNKFNGSRLSLRGNKLDNSVDNSTNNSNNPTNSIGSHTNVTAAVALGITGDKIGVGINGPNNQSTNTPQNSNSNDIVIPNNGGGSKRRNNKGNPRREMKRVDRVLEREIREKQCGIFNSKNTKLTDVSIDDINNLPSEKQEEILEIIEQFKTHYSGYPVPKKGVNGDKNGSNKEKEKAKEKGKGKGNEEEKDTDDDDTEM